MLQMYTVELFTCCRTSGLISFLVIMNKGAMNIFCTSFCVNLRFHFSVKNVQELQLLGIMIVAV